MSEEKYITQVGKRSFRTADNELYMLTAEARESLCGTYGLGLLAHIRNREELQKMRDELKKHGFEIIQTNTKYIVSIHCEQTGNDATAEITSIDCLADTELDADAGELLEQAMDENAGERPKKKRTTTKFDIKPISEKF